MPTTHEATATWRGDLASGKGDVSTKSGALKQAATSWTERTEGTGAAGATSPEELLAAAHASCFSMAFATRLAKAGVADPNITVTVDDLANGKRIECKDILEMLAIRIAATRALIGRPVLELQGTGSAA